VVHEAGYRDAIAILLLTPLVWSLPTALMVGELANLPGYFHHPRETLPFMRPFAAKSAELHAEAGA
jgi:hypothetical protein